MRLAPRPKTSQKGHHCQDAYNGAMRDASTALNGREAAVLLHNVWLHRTRHAFSTNVTRVPVTCCGTLHHGSALRLQRRPIGFVSVARVDALGCHLPLPPIVPGLSPAPPSTTPHRLQGQTLSVVTRRLQCQICVEKFNWEGAKKTPLITGGGAVSQGRAPTEKYSICDCAPEDPGGGAGEGWC